MEIFFTWRKIVVALSLITIVIVLVVLIYKPVTYQPPFDIWAERSQEEVKKREQDFNVFKSSGICVGCDLGRRGGANEGVDLRRIVKLIRSKGLPIDLSKSNLCGVYLNGSNLSGANLSGADLRGAFLVDADLTGANLEGAILSGADLRKANLTGANLHGAELFRTDLNDANLTQVDLTRASLLYTHCFGAKFVGADLRGALISATNLFDKADVTHAKFDGAFVRLLRILSYLVLENYYEICEVIKRLVGVEQNQEIQHGSRNFSMNDSKIFNIVVFPLPLPD